MTLGKKIVTERKKIGYSQEEFAEKVGVSRQTIYKWETDQAMPDIVNLKKIAEVLNLGIEQLLSDEEIKDEPQATIEKAVDTEDKTIKKHGRKGGYLLLYRGIALLIVSIICILIIDVFFKFAYNAYYPFGESSYEHGIGTHHKAYSYFESFGSFALVQTIFKVLLFILMGVALILIVVKIVPALKDYRFNHKEK